MRLHREHTANIRPTMIFAIIKRKEAHLKCGIFLRPSSQHIPIPADMFRPPPMQRVMSNVQAVHVRLLKGRISRTEDPLSQVDEAVLCMVSLVIRQQGCFLQIPVGVDGGEVVVVGHVGGQHGDVETVEEHQAVQLVEGRDDVGVWAALEDGVDGDAGVGG